MERVVSIMKLSTRDMVLSAVFAAIIAVFAVITVPIGEIPVTLGLFGVGVAAAVLGPKRGAISVLVYVLVGLVGLPVFSGFKGGFSVLTGATGGYLSSYIFTALIIGFAAKASAKLDKVPRIAVCFLGCIVGYAVCYFFGTLQFMAISDNGLAAALGMCVIPFIPFDIAKAVAVSLVAPAVSDRLKSFK